MKKSLLFLLAGFLIIVSGCTKDKEDEQTAETACLIGTWFFVENNFTKSFTFHEDKTGTEVQAIDDIRDFTWSIVDGSPVIVYVGETNKWTFDLNCEKNELTIFLAVYKKDLK